jgi:hypothetical protein
MPKDYQLELSPGPDGPWRVVYKGDTGQYSHGGGEYCAESEIFSGTSRCVCCQSVVVSSFLLLVARR